MPEVSGEEQSAADQAAIDQFVEAACDFMALLDLVCGDFPKGIGPEHRRVAERLGVELPPEGEATT